MTRFRAIDLPWFSWRRTTNRSSRTDASRASTLPSVLPSSTTTISSSVKACRRRLSIDGRRYAPALYAETATVTRGVVIGRRLRRPVAGQPRSPLRPELVPGDVGAAGHLHQQTAHE